MYKKYTFLKLSLHRLRILWPHQHVAFLLFIYYSFIFQNYSLLMGTSFGTYSGPIFINFFSARNNKMAEDCTTIGPINGPINGQNIFQ